MAGPTGRRDFDGLRHERAILAVVDLDIGVRDAGSVHERRVPPAAPVDRELVGEGVTAVGRRLVDTRRTVPDHGQIGRPVRDVVDDRRIALRNAAHADDEARRIHGTVAIEVEGIFRRLDLPRVEGVAVCIRTIIAVLEARIRGVGRETVAIEIVRRGLGRRRDEDEIVSVPLRVALRLHASDGLAVDRRPRRDLDGAREVVDE